MDDSDLSGHLNDAEDVDGAPLLIVNKANGNSEHACSLTGQSAAGSDSLGSAQALNPSTFNYDRESEEHCRFALSIISGFLSGTRDKFARFSSEGSTQVFGVSRNSQTSRMEALASGSVSLLFDFLGDVSTIDRQSQSLHNGSSKRSRELGGIFTPPLPSSAENEPRLLLNGSAAGLAVVPYSTFGQTRALALTGNDAALRHDEHPVLEHYASPLTPETLDLATLVSTESPSPMPPTSLVSQVVPISIAQVHSPTPCHLSSDDEWHASSAVSKVSEMPMLAPEFKPSYAERQICDATMEPEEMPSDGHASTPLKSCSLLAGENPLRDSALLPSSSLASGGKSFVFSDTSGSVRRVRRKRPVSIFQPRRSTTSSHPLGRAVEADVAQLLRETTISGLEAFSPSPSDTLPTLTIQDKGKENTTPGVANLSCIANSAQLLHNYGYTPRPASIQDDTRDLNAAPSLVSDKKIPKPAFPLNIKPVIRAEV